MLKQAAAFWADSARSGKKCAPCPLSLPCRVMQHELPRQLLEVVEQWLPWKNVTRVNFAGLLAASAFCHVASTSRLSSVLLSCRGGLRSVALRR